MPIVRKPRPSRPIPDDWPMTPIPKTNTKCAKAAITGRGSLRNAIKAKCLDCTAYQRVEITNCGAIYCPLWIYRPFQVTVDANIAAK